MKIDRSFVGHTLDACTYNVDAERVKAYAQATNDERTVYVDKSVPGGIVAPPLFAVVPQMAVVNAMIADLSLPMDRILHREQDMTFCAPIRPGDRLVSNAQVVGIRDTPTNQIVTSEIATRTQTGEPRARSLMTIVVRDPSAIGRSQQTASNEASRPEPLTQHTMAVRPDQAQVYAGASGDRNAPHTDESFARSIGFRNVILQGLCTMAFASKAIVDSVCQRDPTKLRRMKVRFSDIVYPNDILTTAIWADEGFYAFETANQHGTLVIKGGEARVRP